MRLEQDVPLDGLTDTLNATMPEGIRVLDVKQADERAPALQVQVLSAEYEVVATEAGFGSDLKRRIDSVMESESIIRSRRGKEYDLSSLILSLECDLQEEFPAIRMVLSAKEGDNGTT